MAELPAVAADVPQRSFVRRRLKVTFILTGSGMVFPGTNSNTLVLDGLRTVAVVQAVANQATQADIRVYGMRQQDMDALTVLWFNLENAIRNHVVILEASSDNGATWSQVFSGAPIEAQAEYRGAPEVFFHVMAQLQYFAQLNPTDATSYPGAASVVSILESLATKTTLRVQNNGVTAVLKNPYFYGTAFDQMRQVCRAAGIDWYLKGDVFAIAPRGSPRLNPPVVILSPTSGLIGYPVAGRAGGDIGITLQCLYNPAIDCGFPLEVRDSAQFWANGKWKPVSMQHTLSANMPNGPWSTELFCLPVRPLNAQGVQT